MTEMKSGVDSTEERGGVAGSDGLDEQLVDRAKAGGLRVTGEGGVLQQLTKRLLKLGLAVQPTDVRTFERAAAEYLATLVDAQKRTAAEHRRDLNTHVRPAVVDYRTGGGSVRGTAAGRPVTPSRSGESVPASCRSTGSTPRSCRRRQPSPSVPLC